jgi:hypothetical protein
MSAALPPGPDEEDRVRKPADNDRGQHLAVCQLGRALLLVTRLRPMASATTKDPTLTVELEHLDHVLAPHAAIVDRDRVHTRIHVDRPRTRR